VCKAPGATLVPPSFQSLLAFSLLMLSTGSGCLKPTRENSARAYFNNYFYCFFPEATPPRSPNFAGSVVSNTAYVLVADSYCKLL
jgi:hypothetical protein